MSETVISKHIEHKIKQYTDKYSLQEAYEFYWKNKETRDFPLLEFCKKLNIAVYELPKQYEQKWDGALAKIEGLYQIFLNTVLMSVRKRFTLAHELGHIFYEHPLKENINHDGDKNIEFLPRGAEYILRDLGHTKEEREANDFAATLLLPEENLRADIKEIEHQDSEPNVNKEELIRQKYQVSLAFLHYRLENLNIKANW